MSTHAMVRIDMSIMIIVVCDSGCETCVGVSNQCTSCASGKYLLLQSYKVKFGTCVSKGASISQTLYVQSAEITAVAM
jgi:hypothetical protein